MSLRCERPDAGRAWRADSRSYFERRRQDRRPSSHALKLQHARILARPSPRESGSPSLQVPERQRDSEKRPATTNKPQPCEPYNPWRLIKLEQDRMRAEVSRFVSITRRSTLRASLHIILIP